MTGDDFGLTVLAIIFALGIYDAGKSIAVGLWRAERQRRTIATNFATFKAHLAAHIGACARCDKPLREHEAILVHGGAFAKCPVEPVASAPVVAAVPIFLSRPTPGSN